MGPPAKMASLAPTVELPKLIPTTPLISTVVVLPPSPSLVPASASRSAALVMISATELVVPTSLTVIKSSILACTASANKKETSLSANSAKRLLAPTMSWLMSSVASPSTEDRMTLASALVRELSTRATALWKALPPNSALAPSSKLNCSATLLLSPLSALVLPPLSPPPVPLPLHLPPLVLALLPALLLLDPVLPVLVLALLPALLLLDPVLPVLPLALATSTL